MSIPQEMETSPLSASSAPAESNLSKIAAGPQEQPFKEQQQQNVQQEPLLNPILKPHAPPSPSPRKNNSIVHPRLAQGDRVPSLPNMHRPTSPQRGGSSPRPASPSPKPAIQRTISLKAIGDSVKALVGGSPSSDDIIQNPRPAVPERESEKPFPFVKLHVVVDEKPKEPPPFPGVKLHVVDAIDVKPVFPGIPLHLPVEVDDEANLSPRAFPGLRLHVVDEQGQKRTFAAPTNGPSSPKHQDGGGVKPVSPRPSGVLPLELEVRAKARVALGSPEPQPAKSSPRKLVAVPTSGQYAMQGHRDNMEDAHVWLDWLRDEVPSLPWENRLSFYAVYDGHGGPECAHALRPIVHQNIVSCQEFSSGDIQAALKNGFISTDKQIIDQATKDGWKSGATAVVALLTNDQVYCANLGDSELVLGRRKKSGEPSMDAVLLTFKHKPSSADERKRIEALGGTVVFGRLFGDLAVSRAFGDKDYKKPVWEVDYVSCDPYISQTKLEPLLDEFLIMACDGLWDKITYQEAVDMVRDWRAKGKTAEDCAQLLSDASYQRNSRDNISTIVIFLSWVTEERDQLHRQQLRDAPRKSHDLSSVAPYVPSGNPSPPAAASPASPLIAMSYSAGDVDQRGKRGKQPPMVRTNRQGLAGYTVTPSTSPTVASPLVKAPSESSASSASSSQSKPEESPIATSVRESVTWEHSVSQTILAFAEEKKAALQSSSSNSTTL